MAKLVNGRGNLPIEKSFGWVDGVKVGLIRVSSGTKDEKVYARLLDMLSALRETGRAEVLLDIRDRRRKPLEVLRYYRQQKLSELPPITATGAYATFCALRMGGFGNEEERRANKCAHATKLS